MATRLRMVNLVVRDRAPPLPGVVCFIIVMVNT